MKQRVAIQGEWSVFKTRLEEPNDLYRFLAKFKMLSRGLAVWGMLSFPWTQGPRGTGSTQATSQEISLVRRDFVSYFIEFHLY